LIEKRMAAHLNKIHKLLFPSRMLFLLAIGAFLFLSSVFLRRTGPSTQSFLKNRLGPFLPGWAGLVGLAGLCVCEVASVHLPKDSGARGKLSVVFIIAGIITFASWDKVDASAAMPLIFLFIGSMIFRVVASSSRWLKREKS
jgi:hypothetical protein